MRLRSLFSVLPFLLVFSQVSAQRQNVYFIKNSGEHVDVKDSADYIRIVSEPDSGSTLYNVKEYYKNGKRKLIGKSSTIDPITLEGQAASFYLSGKRNEVCNYEKGQYVGDYFKYYPNGVLYIQKQYKSLPVKQGTTPYTTELVIANNDSTGKQLVVDGSGQYVGYSNDFKDVIETGQIKAGVRDGQWQGNNGYKKNLISYTEEYRDGKFVSGQSVDASNKVVNYVVEAVEPVPKGGMQAFYQYLGNNIQYPYEARKNNVQGKVFIRFVVEKDGTITDAKILLSPNSELGAEALRVVSESPKWIPGLQYGRLVRVQYTVPVNFALSK